MKLISKVLLAGAVVIAAKGLDNRLEVTHYSVNSDKIPDDFDGLRILHLSDFHCDTTAGLSNAVRDEKPDIICITGDMTHDTGTITPFTDLLKELLEIAPVYVISGNHDIWRNDYNELMRICEELGAVHLKDKTVKIEKGNSHITLSGIEDPSSVNHHTIYKRISESLKKLEIGDDFNILLFHRANLMDIFENKGFDLILSGHMHGGQFRLPGVGGVVSPKTNFMSKGRIIFPKYFGGEYNLGKTKMIVSRGVGNPTVLPRIFNRPEICIVVLKKNPIA